MYRRDRLDLGDVKNRDIWPLVAADMPLPSLDELAEYLRDAAVG